MTIDEYDISKRWLDQFSLVDREVGRQMLRSLRLVSHTQFETGVSNKLIELFNELRDENIGLFSVDELPKDQDLKQPPRRVAGSSADRVKHINEGLARIYGPRVQAHPTRHSMRAQKMKNVVLVDDFIGTGRRIETYLKSVMSPTLKSWISYKWTKLWIVCYGGLEAGVQKILQKGYGLTEERLRLATPAQQPGQFFSPLMQGFCRAYSKRTRRPNIPLGIGEGAVAMIFEHACPNNAPVLLWSPGPKYTPVFPERGIPVELKPAFYQDDVNRPAEVLWDVTQYRLALAMLREPNLERHQGSQWRLLLMLGLASRSGWNDSRIAGILGIPVTDVAALRLEAYRIGVLDAQSHILTDFGRGLLEKIRSSASQKRIRPQRKQRSLTDVYYPWSCVGLIRH